MSRHQPRRHVYLFRHCVRSTSGTVDDVNFHGSKTPLSDYTSQPLPDWRSTESMDCTRRGLKIMEGEGQHIGRELLDEMSSNGQSRIRLRFVSDITKRDSDTTLALVRGFYDVFERGSIDVSVTYDQDLFKPLVANRMSFGLKRYIEYNQTSLCEKRYTNETYKAQIEKRLTTLARPEGDLLDIYKVLQKVTGSDAWVDGDEPAKITVSEEGTILGTINALRDLTQAMFYSSASNMSPEFLPDVTVDQLYRLLEWTYWYQALTEMDNSQATTIAAPLAASILQALREEAGGDETDDHDDVLNVSIFVGHDTDISRVASLFGLRFDLDPPYYTSPRAAGLYAPAPPGSAMHFVHDVVSQFVEMTFVYPVLIAANGHLYWDGRVTTVSMKKRNSPTDAIGRDGKHKFRRRRLSVIGSDKDDRGLRLLEDRIKSNLLKYEGALECFKRANELPSWRREGTSRSAGDSAGVIEPGIAIRSDDSADYLRIISSIGIVCAFVITVLLLKKHFWPTAAERANAVKTRHRRILSGDGSVDDATQRRRILSAGESVYDDLELVPTHSD
mmetsp:Transcript_29938/g.60755  ORF Transcript_29938/g.60755 Transcript_29938/m.60755 type:complete len:559 (-) Transcript_29938:1614-3290(-)